MLYFRRVAFSIASATIICVLGSTGRIVANGRSSSAPLNVEDIVKRNIASIGSSETLASIQSRLIVGTTKALSKGVGVSQFAGNVALASVKEKNLISMTFASANYPFERVGYNGEKVTVAYVRPGFRTVLGDFCYTYNIIFKEGLVGGTLSSAWPLLNPEAMSAKLALGGKKRFDGREAYEIRYTPRSGSDLAISLFFDTTTYEHIRSEFRRTVSAQMGVTIDKSAERVATRFLLSEDFSDFRNEGGLNLPHGYKIHLSVSGERNTLEADWTSALRDFRFNQKIDLSEFSVIGATK
jgi:hypothetical protein